MVSFQHITTDVGQLLIKRASLLILWASSLELLHKFDQKV